jgi:hypothetical protein
MSARCQTLSHAFVCSLARLLASFFTLPSLLKLRRCLKLRLAPTSLLKLLCQATRSCAWFVAWQFALPLRFVAWQVRTAKWR